VVTRGAFTAVVLGIASWARHDGSGAAAAGSLYGVGSEEVLPQEECPSWWCHL